MKNEDVEKSKQVTQMQENQCSSITTPSIVSDHDYLRGLSSGSGAIEETPKYSDPSLFTYVTLPAAVGEFEPISEGLWENTDSNIAEVPATAA